MLADSHLRKGAAHGQRPTAQRLGEWAGSRRSQKVACEGSPSSDHCVWDKVRTQHGSEGTLRDAQGRGGDPEPPGWPGEAQLPAQQ